MDEEAYFFDSYAFFEVLNGTLSYKKYELAVVLTTKLNIFEVYHGLLRDVGLRFAEEFLQQYYPCCIDYDADIVKKAATLKVQNKQKNLSMTDCIGYIIARHWGIPFLTGDKEFQNVEGVEFVK